LFFLASCVLGLSLFSSEVFFSLDPCVWRLPLFSSVVLFSWPLSFWGCLFFHRWSFFLGPFHFRVASSFIEGLFFLSPLHSGVASFFVGGLYFLAPCILGLPLFLLEFFFLASCKSSAYSCGLNSVPRQMTLSGIVGPSATFLKSPSASIAFLDSTEASCLDGGYTCSCCSVSSLRKCTLLWPGAKRRSMFLASF
jgi:hypothetical protein